MKIQVNNKETELAEGGTVADLAQSLGLPAHGVAIALHRQMVPKDAWSNTVLHEGDSLIVIRAACGG